MIPAGEVLAVVHEHGHVLAATRQLQDLEPDDQVVFGVDLIGRSTVYSMFSQFTYFPS